MDYAFICDHFPQLEYLFGCYLPRYRNTAQSEPERVIRRFALRKPTVLNETADQLQQLIEYCAGDSRSGDSALEFLEILDCPYYPPIYGRSAIEWLRAVHATLCRYLPATNERRLPRGAAAYEPLISVGSLSLPNEFDSNDDLPLQLVNVFLQGYERLQGAMPAPGIHTDLLQSDLELSDAEITLPRYVLLSRTSEPLLEVPFGESR